MIVADIALLLNFVTLPVLVKSIDPTSVIYIVIFEWLEFSKYLKEVKVSSLADYNLRCYSF